MYSLYWVYEQLKKILAVFEYVSWLLEMLAIFVSVNIGQGKNSSLLFIILEKCL